MGLLSPQYLFPEVNARKKAFLQTHPEASILSLGIGDTTEPIPLAVADALSKASIQLGTKEGYSGYGSEQGMQELREAIASVFYAGAVQGSEVFISDGAKCDIGRLQMLFGREVSIALQDPTYPVYRDGSLIQGVSSMVFMECTPENGFFPNLATLPRTDILYFCSPNNPTGSVATRDQLTALVRFAEKNQSIILFDAAYAAYIQDPSLPTSIFEIEGARHVAIEINSFSKLAGFTGVRLGWTVVPKELRYDDGSSVHADWNRLTSTVFNGPSNIAQRGGLAVLEEEGLRAVDAITRYYLENAAIIKQAFQQRGYEVFGGDNAPCLWVRFPGEKSWNVFQRFLEQYHIVTTPGSGFGAKGEGFLRLTAFSHREHVIEAICRLQREPLTH